MNPKIAAEWPEYNVGQHSSQHPPLLQTVHTVEKLERLTKEHSLKVVNEGT